tara:strand:+ start:97 stop:891 length:795 start_codon:yes stop_codon:yes gene_type:complete
MGLSSKQKKFMKDFLIKEYEAKVERFTKKPTDGLKQHFAASTSIPKDERIIHGTVHSMLTTYGMSFYEDIAKQIAEPISNITKTQWKSNLKVSQDRLTKISEIVEEHGTGKRMPDIDAETVEILSIPNKNLIDSNDGQVVDVYFKRGNDEYYIDIKTVGPNLPGFIALRKNNLKWIARANKKIHPIVAIPYNPFYPKPYEKVGSDRMELGKDLLVGKEFWDLVGGSAGCYEDIVATFKQIGHVYFQKMLSIARQYYGRTEKMRK